MSQFAAARGIYASHVYRLMRPGGIPRMSDRVDELKPADLRDAPEALIAILIDEGRRFSDAATAELNAIRAKAQVAFTIDLLLLGALTAQFIQAKRHGGWLWLPFVASVALALLALVGALAVAVIEISVPIIHPAVASHYADDVHKRLARDYALNATDWNNVLGTERSVLREACLYLTLAGASDALSWIVLHH